MGVEDAALNIIRQSLTTTVEDAVEERMRQDAVEEIMGQGECQAEERMRQDAVEERMRQGECKAEIPPDDVLLPVPGLKEVLLDALVFNKYGNKAWQWCDDNGAVDLEEIIDCAEDFSSALGLK